MGEASALLRESAKPSRATSYPPKGNKPRKILPFELFLREIWPEERSVAKKYMRLTGAAESTAKLRIRGKHRPPYEEIIALLQSEFGLQFLDRVLGDDPPEWFRGFKRAKHIGDMRRRQAQLQRELAQIEMQIE